MKAVLVIHADAVPKLVGAVDPRRLAQEMQRHELTLEVATGALSAVEDAACLLYVPAPGSAPSVPPEYRARTILLGVADEQVPEGVLGWVRETPFRHWRYFKLVLGGLCAQAHVAQTAGLMAREDGDLVNADGTPVELVAGLTRLVRAALEANPGAG